MRSDTGLRGAISAVIRQTETEWELVVVDDASDDATPSILREFHDSRIRLIRNESPLGIPKSRNLATEAARAPVIVIMDADDVSAPSRIARQLEFLRRNPAVGAVGSFVDAVDREGVSLGILKTLQSGADARAHRLKSIPLIHPSVAVRKGVLERVGGYRERFHFAADYDMLCRVCEVCEVATIPEPLCRYRLSPKSVSIRSRRQQAFYIRLAKRFAAERESEGRDSYDAADWHCPNEDAGAGGEADYHIFVGKLAFSLGNAVLAREHFRASARLAPWRPEPRALDALLWMGTWPYWFLKIVFGSA